MHYHIKISGGVAGFLREFKGELPLDDDLKAKLKALFEHSKKSLKNKNLRDGFNYFIELEIDQVLYRESYDDSNLPMALRQLIDLVKK